MDFIERWFGMSPDGGNGTFEVTLVFIALIVLAAPLVVRRLRSAARRSGGMNER
jgi:hypothetical protein